MVIESCWGGGKSSSVGPSSCHGNRLTYLAVSSACNIHVKDELSLLLGAVGPWWAADKQMRVRRPHFDHMLGKKTHSKVLRS